MLKYALAALAYYRRKHRMAKGIHSAPVDGTNKHADSLCSRVLAVSKSFRVLAVGGLLYICSVILSPTINEKRR